LLAVQIDLGPKPVERLADMLREAEAAHRGYERTLGRADENWPAWYARHIIDRLTESEESRSE
jgi:hypothetical protein